VNDGVGVRVILEAVVVAQSLCTWEDRIRLSRVQAVLWKVVAKPTHLCRHSHPPSGPHHETCHVQMVASSASVPLCFAT
jgi:phage baseplate assembly protein W